MLLASALAVFILPALPARALIIDIDASVNELSIDPVMVSLAAGTYSVTPIGISGGGAFDAWNPWGSTTCIISTGCPRTIPTTVTGWKYAYDVMSDAITAVSVDGSPLAPVSSEPGGYDQIQDYWVANGTETDRYHVDDGNVYPSAVDALAAAESSTFTVGTSGLVGFGIRNGNPSDNLGGISLQVLLVVPEPSTAALLVLGLASLGLVRRR